jgi:hypothetical protein
MVAPDFRSPYAKFECGTKLQFWFSETAWFRGCCFCRSRSFRQTLFGRVAQPAESGRPRPRQYSNLQKRPVFQTPEPLNCDLFTGFRVGQHACLPAPMLSWRFGTCSPFLVICQPFLAWSSLREIGPRLGGALGRKCEVLNESPILRPSLRWGISLCASRFITGETWGRARWRSLATLPILRPAPQSVVDKNS